MSKKLDFDKTIEKVESVSNKINVIMQNKLIIAIFLIVDGVTFILNPDTTLSGIAKNIILLALLATFSILITNLSSKTKDLKTIIISLLILAIGAFFYFNPDLISAYIQLLLSLFIIYDGIKNIANMFHIGNLSKYTEALNKKYHKILHRKEPTEKRIQERAKFKEIDDNINNELKQQETKLIAPLRSMVNKTSEHSVLFIITNAISIIFGFILLVFPNISMTIWGIIFLYTGSTNLFASLKTMDLLHKIKKK